MNSHLPLKGLER